MDIDTELDAPCRWCGYNGQSYHQSGSHSTECPWHEIGGREERLRLLQVSGWNKDKAVISALNKLRTFVRDVRCRKAGLAEPGDVHIRQQTSASSPRIMRERAGTAPNLSMAEWKSEFEALVMSEREACAKVIEDNQERITSTANGDVRSVAPRHPGNLAGLAYADAIRARSNQEQ